MKKQSVYCPKCREPNSKNLGIYKEAIRGYRRLMTKYRCLKCGWEFWK